MPFSRGSTVGKQRGKAAEGIGKIGGSPQPDAGGPIIDWWMSQIRLSAGGLVLGLSEVKSAAFWPPQESFVRAPYHPIFYDLVFG